MLKGGRRSRRPAFASSLPAALARVLFFSQTTMVYSTSASLIIPVFNEQAALLVTVEGMRVALAETGIEFEIIVINDGSTDGTAELLESIPDLRVVTHDRKRGYGAAIKTGMHLATHDSIVITDADGTYPATAVMALLGKLRSVDMAVGARTGKQVHYSVIRKVPKVFLKLFAEWIVGRSIPDLNSGMRAFRKSSLVRFERLLPDGFSFSTTLTVAMLTSGLEVAFEPIDYHQRIGTSKFRPMRDTWNFFVTVLRLGVYFSPMKVFMPIAIVFLFMGCATLLRDIFILQDITDRTIILIMAAANVGLLALLADLITRKT
jgi:glycosyltransferase involved in cell wall biosynthesis